MEKPRILFGRLVLCTLCLALPWTRVLSAGDSQVRGGFCGQATSPCGSSSCQNCRATDPTQTGCLQASGNQTQCCQCDVGSYVAQCAFVTANPCQVFSPLTCFCGDPTANNPPCNCLLGTNYCNVAGCL